MSLPNARVKITTGGLSPTDWTFAVLGAIPTGQTEPLERVQAGDPDFSRDQQNAEFEAGVEYRFTAEHPYFSPQAQLVRVVFDANGAPSALSADEAPTTTPTTPTTDPGTTTATLQQVTANGPVADSMPYFNGGITAILSLPPAGENLPSIVIGNDGVFYRSSEAQTGLITSIVFDQFEHFQYVPDSAALPDAYIGRFDFNTCGVNGNAGQAGGWFANANHPLTSVVVRVDRDGVFYKNVTADRPRSNDVRLYLENQGLVTTSRENFSWIVDKSLDDNDGKPHTYRFYGGTSNVEATSDRGESNTITCGTAAPTVTQYVVNGSATIAGGEEGSYFVNANMSDETTRPYIGPGTFSKQGSWPTGPVLTPGASATAKVSNPIGTVNTNTTVTLRFTLPGDGTVYNETTLSLLASGLLGVKYAVLTSSAGSGYRDLKYYLKSTVDLIEKIYINGTLVYTGTISPSVSDAGGYTRIGGLNTAVVGDTIKNEYYYVGGTTILFQNTVTIGSTVTLTTIYP